MSAGRTRWVRRRARPAAIRSAALLLAALFLSVAVAPSATAGGPYSLATGSGSSYAGLAFQQWIADASAQGLPVNYQPSSSPQGLTAFESSSVQFAGTEAEFASLTSPPSPSLSYEYTPDVAGAIAVAYNAQDQSGAPITYLHLSQRTVARIFMGYISNWDDPEISADNLGLKLPSHPITVVYRTGQSGTTALFYDFVAHADPTDFVPWARANDLPTTTRIIELDTSPHFTPYNQGFSGSDQQAQTVATTPWTISYDEFAYPKVYGAQVAWVQNGDGKYTQPYAVNISAALQAATLNPDLSQNLSGVYTDKNPIDYPISAYSYIVTPCANLSTGPQFATCHGTYGQAGTPGNASVANTVGDFMSYVACGGQVDMAAIGYAPLPPNLSQDVANSVARITGRPVVTFTAANCANPRFKGLLGVGAAGPPDPYLSLSKSAGGGTTGGSTGGGGTTGGSGSTGGGSTSTGGTGTSSGAAAKATTTGAAGGSATTATASGVGAATAASSGAARSSSGGTAAVAVGSVGAATQAVGGGTGTYRSPAPIAYTRPIPGLQSSLPLIIFLVILALPLLWIGGLRSRFSRARR